MATNTELEYLGRTGTEQLVANVKALVDDHSHPEQVSFHGVTTEGDGSTYTATVSGIDALVAGATFIMIPNVTSTVATPKLNVNGLGAKNIRRRVSNSTVTTAAASSANWLYKNKPIRMMYDGTYWIADLDRPNATDIYGTLPVASGGTGATTAASALTNLGAEAAGTASTLVTEHNADTSAHSDIRNAITQLSTEKVDRTSIVQTTGESETAVMSQKAVTDALADILAQAGQQAPLFANSIEECTDTTKLYVLPDGMIYAYMLTEKEVEVEGTGGYTNLLPTATDTDRTTIYNGKGYKENTRLSGSSGSAGAAGTGKEAMCASGFIFPVKAGDILRIKGISPVTSSSHYVVGYDSSNARTGNDVIQFTSSDGTLIFTTTGSSGMYTIDEDGTIVYTINTATLGANVNAVRISAAMDENTIITLNEEIVEGGGTTTETVKEYAWASTGHAFVPADYEDRIIEVEKTTTEHTAQIAALEKAVESGATDNTETDALNRIKVWDKPVYDVAPVTLLGDDRIKPALTSEDRTIEAIYAKYRALRDDPDHPENALYITETNLGLCTTSDLVPGFEGKDMLRFDFKEPDGITELDDPSTPKVPDPARETKPKLIFLSGIHKEWAGVYGLYYALEEIANNPEFEDIRRNAHIIVIPCANPFGLIAEYTTTTNGWAAPSDWGAPSHVNANGIAPHNNFGVGYTANQNVIGSYNHSGSEAYSELETQYIDQVMAENSDAIAFVSCHNFNNGGSGYGCTAMWASSATYHMCNLVYRLVDKLSKAWVRKYGDTLKQSIDSIKQNMSAADYRLGRATMSTSAGTEQQNATKYGILAVNLEISDKWVVFSNTQFSSETMTHGAEVYANFIRTILRAYDHKDKKEYAPNLPWCE